MPDDDPTPPLEELAAVGRYPRFSHAQERGLVAAAMDKPYWVIREGPDFVLYVERADREVIEAELVQFEEESRERKAQQQMVAPPLPKTDTLPLFLGAWIFSMYWMGRSTPPEWVELGDSANRAIFAGEWWRTITALTLHGDLPHFIANLMFGLLFAAFLLPRFGGGGMWLGIVLSGGLGNWLNAYFYRREDHHTVGASTAVFGGLGMLVAWELLSRWRLPHTRSWWHLVVPLGGGLALLTYLGAGGDEGGQRVDYMAHLWGFVAGGGIGLLAGIFPVNGAAQRVAGWIAFALPVVAWALALRK